jgi:hypothetical protein
MSTAPKCFRDMTQEERAELIAAREQGFSIELFVPALDAWKWARFGSKAEFVEDLCYRVARDDEGMVTVTLPFSL